MSEQRYPVVMCDGDDGECGVVEMDHTLGGLGRIVGSSTQLPEGWSGDAPGSPGDDKHYCPTCTIKRACAGGHEWSDWKRGARSLTGMRWRECGRPGCRASTDPEPIPSKFPAVGPR